MPWESIIDAFVFLFSCSICAVVGYIFGYDDGFKEGMYWHQGWIDGDNGPNQ